MMMGHPNMQESVVVTWVWESPKYVIYGSMLIIQNADVYWDSSHFCFSTKIYINGDIGWRDIRIYQRKVTFCLDIYALWRLSFFFCYVYLYIYIYTHIPTHISCIVYICIAFIIIYQNTKVFKNVLTIFLIPSSN